MDDPYSKIRRISLIATEEEKNRQAQPAKWNETHVTGIDFDSIREERITVHATQLAPDVYTTLSGCQLLHIRWVRPASYDTLDPLAARLPPGLHVVVERDHKDPVELQKICKLLKDTFGVVPCSGDQSFTKLSPSQFQFYHPIKKAISIKPTQAEALCGPWNSQESCKPFFESLSNAAWFDINWDRDGGKLKLSSLSPLETRTLDERHYDGSRTEVILWSRPQSIQTSPDAPPGPNKERPDEVNLEGPHHRIEPGSPMGFTMTAAPTRHRNHQGTYSVSFSDPAGLHPAMKISMSTRRRPDRYDDDVECKLYAYMTLPRSIFADRYQLQDAFFLESKNLADLKFSTANVDLEAPEYTVKTWGSAVLLELLPPDPDPRWDGKWKAEIPLHLRYMKPAPGGYSQFDVPYPTVFWACDLAHDAGPTLGPWDILGFGYDAFFKPDTTYWHLQPVAGPSKELFNTIGVPVADQDLTTWVPFGTALVVALGTLWVIWNLFSAWSQTPQETVAEKGDRKSESKDIVVVKESVTESGNDAGNGGDASSSSGSD